MLGNIKKSVWERSCGKKSEGYDYAGRRIRYSAYNNTGSIYGWNISPINPKSKSGEVKICSLILSNLETTIEKGNDFPHWKSNGKNFKAVKSVKNCYNIVEY